MLIKNIKKKKAKAFHFLHGSKPADFTEIGAKGAKIMDAVRKQVAAKKIPIAGPSVWSYDHLPTGKMKMHAGLQVKQGTRAKAPLAVRKVPEWTCISATYKGSMKDIQAAWMEFMAVVEKRKLRMAPANREIYHKWIGMDSKDNVTEFQIKLAK
jgi:predicted transcriptional regulator YdeE